MAYQDEDRIERLEVCRAYAVFAGADGRQQLADDPAAYVRRLIADSDEPTPNEITVHQRSVTDEGGDWIDDILMTMKPEPTTPAPPPPDPPQALIFHQETGAAASRYITIVLGS